MFCLNYFEDFEWVLGVAFVDIDEMPADAFGIEPRPEDRQHVTLVVENKPGRLRIFEDDLTFLLKAVLATVEKSHDQVALEVLVVELLVGAHRGTTIEMMLDCFVLLSWNDVLDELEDVVWIPLPKMRVNHKEGRNLHVNAKIFEVQLLVEIGLPSR